jgi:hypothetical protein
MIVRNYNNEKKEFDNIFIGSPSRYHSRFICYKDEINFVYFVSDVLFIILKKVIV